MQKVSDELVERVAQALALGHRVTFNERNMAKRAIAALSTPDFASAILAGLSDEEQAKIVLPLAEEMLRSSGAWGALLARDTLLDNYRAAKAERCRP